MSEVQVKQKKDNIFVLIIALVIIAAVAAGVLAVVDYVTQKPRDEAALQVTINAFKQLQPDFNNEPVEEERYIVSDNGSEWHLLPEGESIEKYGTNIVSIYPARKDGKLISLFAEGVRPEGYGGNITVLLAMKLDASIINVVVTDQNETPGLGTAVFARQIKKSIWGIIEGKYKDDQDKLAPNPVMDFFNGKEFIPDDKYTAEDKEKSNIVPASKWQVAKDGGDFKYVTGATITSRAVTSAVKKIVSAYYFSEKEILEVFDNKKN